MGFPEETPGLLALQARSMQERVVAWSHAACGQVASGRSGGVTNGARPDSELLQSHLTEAHRLAPGAW